ncbi:fibroblast growth factor receptor 4-like [Oculina patagonica]
MLLRSNALLLTATFIVLINEARVKPCAVPEIREKRGNDWDKKVVEVIAGKDVRLICQVKDKDVSAYWLKNNKTLHPSDHQRMRIKANKYLKIKKTEKGDAGFYTCVAVNDCGKNTYTMQLFVESPTKDPNRNSTPAAPRFTVPKEKLARNLLAFPVGNSVKLDCSADGHPRPTVRWYKDGALFQQRKGGSRLYLSSWTLLLTMKDLVPTDTGKYTCNVSNAYGWINHTYVVDVHERVRAEPVVLPMENVTVYVGDNATLLCKALSDSMPHFQWLRWFTSPVNGSTNSTIEHPHYEVIKQNEQDLNQHLVLPQSNNKFDFHGVKLTLVNVTKKDEGKYTCIVGNAVGYAVEQAYIIIRDWSETTTPPQVTTNAPSNATFPPDKNYVRTVQVGALSEPKKTVYIAVFVAVAVVVVVIFGVGFFYCHRKLQFAKGTNYGVVSGIKPNEPTVQYRTHVPSIGSSSSYGSTAPLIRHRSLRSRLGSNLTQVSEVDVPLDEKWEIDRDHIILSGLLGEGAFGRVMKAEAIGLPNVSGYRCEVAVKMLKEDATDHELTDLVSEMEVMKTIGKHKNIINLIGACTQGGPLFVVVEYAPNGNLRQFLKDRRPTREYTTSLTLKDLVSFAYQVARGMEYLSFKKCIHRDLAARNILVGDDHTIKIADFGLARDVHQVDYYRKTTDGRLPVKWMALEALFDRVYTTQSDVWAFGILVWEIVTFGGSPYPGVPLENLFELLKSGYRMEQPLNCPDNMYKIMLKCWQDSPTQRPTFEELVQEFDAMLVSLSEQEYLDLDASLMSPWEPQTPTSSEPPSTPRTSVVTEHDTDNDDRDIDNVFVDNADDILESRDNGCPARTRESENLETRIPLIENRQPVDRKRAPLKSSPDMGERTKQTRVVAYRAPIHSDV